MAEAPKAFFVGKMPNIGPDETVLIAVGAYIDVADRPVHEGADAFDAIPHGVFKAISFVRGHCHFLEHLQDGSVASEHFLATCMLNGITYGTYQRCAVQLSLDEVVVGTSAYRTNGSLLIAAPSEHQDGNPGYQCLQVEKRIQPLAVR